jgi:hypothetical protein
MLSMEHPLSSQLSIEQFLLYRSNNLDMLDELVEFYELCKNVQPPKQNNVHQHQNQHQHQNHNQHHNQHQNQNQNPNQNHSRNADTDNEWTRREAVNWLTENKRNRDEDEKLYAQIRSVLNKLSEDNFDVLVAEIKKLNINDEQHLDKLSEVIFMKALIEPKYCIRYAKLAYDFACYKPYNNDNLSFRRSTINRCQIMFNDLTTTTKEKAKGCMTFIGELYNCDLLPNTIICYCFNELMAMHEKRTDDMEVSLTDCIYVFMKVLGGKFWKNNNKDAKLIFTKLETLMNSGRLSNREKFSLMDTIDLKKKYEALVL